MERRAKTINGFLRAAGRKIVNDRGEVILSGWGLGNWMVPEGYMWLADGAERFDRPRRIERVVEELCGKAYGEMFWRRFREEYICREDILYMAKLGYNSVRIPLNWRLFMEEDEGIRWKQEGFDLLRRCIDWCEEADIYAFIDLHAAPGGQTGANIDDSIDDVPRLFTDQDPREKALALWERLAEEYADREAVGGYDLLNEPVAPGEYDCLIPEIYRFYEDAISRIRKKDKKHIISIEGAHWATDFDCLTRKLDDNMVLHFHRYAEKPEKKCLELFIEKAEQLDVPLWMGETGENRNEWYAALYPLAESLGIGYNLWPWKKMECTNSPCSVKAPEDYEKILDYVRGGAHPGYEAARKIFDEYLEHIRLENCDLHPEVTNHIQRRKSFSLLAIDFDEPAEKEYTYSTENPEVEYRKGCGRYLIEQRKEGEKEFPFDCQWERYALLLREGEQVRYTVNGEKDMILTIDCETEKGARIEVSDAESSYRFSVKSTDKKIEGNIKLSDSGHTTVSIRAVSGDICMKRLEFAEV